MTLHLALVEDTVRYVGGNGVRFHHMVVRKLIGSPAGTTLSASGAKTAVSETIDVPSVAADLDRYLAGYEKTRAEASSGFAFKDRVDQLDAAHLLIVVFVQNDATKEVLQAVVVTPGT